MKEHRLRHLVAGKPVLLLLIGVMLSACFGSSPATRMYALKTETIGSEGAAVTVGVGPLELPDYLKRPQIVVRGPNQQLRIMEFDRWAEPLDRGINRRIAASVNRLVDDAWAYEFLRPSNSQSDYRLAGQVLRFEADESGAVNLELLWGLFDKEQLSTNKNLDLRYSVYTESADAADIDAVTEAMGKLLDRFAADASEVITARISLDQSIDDN